jgi:hypothetical protein
MSADLENYYNSYFDLFRTEGWKQFISDLEQNKEIINSVDAVKDADDLHFRKGQLNVLSFILNFEVGVNNAFEDIEK